jgi:hypothetical protein
MSGTSASPLEADYVIVGAGAVGMGFADTLVAETSASVILADRRAFPGGHWNDAYPFVRLHGPSTTYGVNSLPLGEGRIDRVGFNRGHHELASGAEVCAYFDRVLRERLLPGGRVTWLPMHAVGDDGVALGLLDGRRRRLVARRRWIDATRADTQVPATHGPRFRVAAGATCLTPTELARGGRRPASGYVIVGGGKTSLDTALWLLQSGVDPDAITWIRPREAWLLNRANVQPTETFGRQALAASVAELEAARDATSLRDLFDRLESGRLLMRIDPGVEPTMYRCAIVSEAELAQLRRIRRVVRMGRVRSIETDRLLLGDGALATSTAHVHIHCSAGGLPREGPQPMFQGARIVPQYVRRCSPAFSAAFVAHLEATLDDEEEKNALCEPVPVPEVPLDWLRMHLQTARNQARWAGRPELQDWLRRSRLEAYSGMVEHLRATADPVVDELLGRLRAARVPGLERMAAMLREAGGAGAVGAQAGLRAGRAIPAVAQP